MIANNLVLFYVKFPEKGKVKNRLAKDLDEKIVLELYKKFVEDILLKIVKSRFDFWVCCSPPEKINKISKWLGDKYIYKPQTGVSLGKKMDNSFLKAFDSGYTKVILIGSDIPDLPEDIFSEAFEQLNNYDSVIGPSADGGYYLIGFNKEKYFSEVFDDISWSTERVFKQTLNVFNKIKINYIKLRKWYDVDNLEDLHNLIERDKKKYSTGTMSYIEKIKIMCKIERH